MAQYHTVEEARNFTAFDAADYRLHDGYSFSLVISVHAVFPCDS